VDGGFLKELSYDDYEFPVGCLGVYVYVSGLLSNVLVGGVLHWAKSIIERVVHIIVYLSTHSYY
jgi:hypothetical protein